MFLLQFYHMYICANTSKKQLCLKCALKINKKKVHEILCNQQFKNCLQAYLIFKFSVYS
jgi:hypothetical protein